MTRQRTRNLPGQVALSGAAIAMGWFATAVPALSQSSDTAQVEERLVRIEESLKTLQGVVYSVEPNRSLPPVTGTSISAISATGAAALPAGDANGAQLAVRLSAVEQALAELTGRVEELNFKLDRELARAPDAMPIGPQPVAPGVGGAVTDLPTVGGVATLPAVADGGAAVGVAPPAAQASTGPVDLAAGDEVAEPEIVVTLPDDPDAAYDVGYNAILAGRYGEAEAALEAFIVKFPDSPQTPDAKFLLGEVYLASNADAKAVRVFLDHVSSYENDRRSPDAYLRLGETLARLQKTAEACNVLNTGNAKFRGQSEEMAQKFAAARQAAGCS